MRGSGGHGHQEQPQQEGPEGDAVRLGDLRLDDRPAPPRRRGLAGDGDGTALGRLRVGLGGALEAPRLGLRGGLDEGERGLDRKSVV